MALAPSSVAPALGSTMRRSLALLVLLLAPGLARAEPFAQSIELAPGERFRIELASGDIEIIRHDGPALCLEAAAKGLGASAVEFFVTREAGEIVLRSRAEPWVEWLARGPQVHVRAWVPRELRLAAETTGQVAASDAAARLPALERVAQRPAGAGPKLP
jgi:hypothetical protein